VALLQELVAETRLSLKEQQAVAVAPLRALFDAAVEQGGSAVVEDACVLRAFGHVGASSTMQELWRGVIARLTPAAGASALERAALAHFAVHGNLAARLIQAHQRGADLDTIYRRLVDDMVANRMFGP
jgi:hypothetical protein